MNTPRLTLEEALRLETLRAAALAETGRAFIDEVIIKIARLALPRECVEPVIDDIVRRKGNETSLREIYRYQMASFYPPDKPVAKTRAACETLMELVGLTPDDELFPMGKLFEHLKIAPRKSPHSNLEGFYVTPWHAHEPGDRCCYVLPGGSMWDEYPIGCDNEWTGGADGKPTGANGAPVGDALQDEDEEEYLQRTLGKYLEFGLVKMDAALDLRYGPQAEETEVNLPDGVYTDGAKDLHLIINLKPLRVCNLCYPIAEIVDERGQPQGVLLKFWGGDGWRTHVVPNKALESEGATMFQEMADNGLRVNADERCRATFRKIAKSGGQNLRKVVQYSRPGWHGDRFVLPTGLAVDGSGAAPALVAYECATADKSTGGSFEEWWAQVGSQIWTGETPQFCAGLLAGASGAITKLLQSDHPVVHFSGPPSSGKSTAQIIGAGLTANPEPGRGTLVTLQGAVEETLPKGLGTSAHIDDPTKRGSPRHVERLMYRATEMTPFTVSSVASLERIVEEAGSRMDEGIRRRVVTVDTSKAPRIDFRKADRIKQAALRNFGHVMPRFATELIKQGLHLDPAPLQKIVDEYVDGLPGVTNSESYSAAKLIGVLHAVGCIMHDAGLIPAGADGDALLQGLWSDWLTRRNSTAAGRGAEEVLRALRDPENAPALGQPGEGIWSADGVGYVQTDTLETIIPADTTVHAVVDWLKGKGMLIIGGKGVNKTWSRLPAPDGRDLRHYRIKLAA